jgi:hypothetical protein
LRIIIRLSIGMAALVASATLTARAVAHGTPIQVSVANNALVVSGGLADSKGFAPMIFVEDDEEGDPFGEVVLPGFGPSIIWQVPGYEISGMDEHSGLFLDVLTRPFAHANPIENRALWYWNPQTQKVGTTPAANPLQIRKSASVNVTLSPTDGADPPPLQIAEPLASDMGFHNHLVAYALSDTAPAPVGAYGFFARLTSNQYAASDPFLVVVNNGVVDYQQMNPAALAINAAAFLPGDYNHNGRVDAADYVVWRKSFGSTTELAADGSYNQSIDVADHTFWQLNFGASIAGNAAGNASSVPEPQMFAAIAAGIWSCFMVWGPLRRRG